MTGSGVRGLWGSLEPGLEPLESIPRYAVVPIQLNIPVKGSSFLSLSLSDPYQLFFFSPFFSFLSLAYVIYIYYNPGGDVICKGCGVANDGYFTYCQKKKDRLSN